MQKAAARVFRISCSFAFGIAARNPDINKVSLRFICTSLQVSFAKPVQWGSKKKKHPIKHTDLFQAIMSDPAVEEKLAPLRAAVKEQGDVVRTLKESGAPELDVKQAVAELKARKKILEDTELKLIPDNNKINRALVEDLLKRRFFYDQSFGIYGGITGQFDFGPMGCAIKVNLLNAWRNFFILEEQMLEVDCSILTPEPVLRASGHVERFADLMVKDVKTGDCFRLDHLIKAHLEKIKSEKKTPAEVKAECEDIIIKLDGMTKAEMAAVLQKFNMKSPLTNNDLTEPIEFNLMFETLIGPSGNTRGFLRPETAQGIFVNFKKLLTFNHEKLPFAAAQIGNSFRNEISPRSGLIRVREFTMAEIEHFCDPRDKSHPKFADIKDLELMLYSACDQMDGKPAKLVRLGDAVEGNSEHFGQLVSPQDLEALDRFLSSRSYIHGHRLSEYDLPVLAAVKQFDLSCLHHVRRWASHVERLKNEVVGKASSLDEVCRTVFGSVDPPKKIIANETLGYFIGRIHQFLVKVGVDPKRLRFRQHMGNEMAHYAQDCWDAECLTSYGWVECVGCADRSAYDLSQHAKATGARLTASRKLAEPRNIDVAKVAVQNQVVGKEFRGNAKIIIEALGKLEGEHLDKFESQLKAEGKYDLSIHGQVYSVTSSMVEIKRQTEETHVEDFIPNVIEPSFGIGRIMYAVFEHNFRIRDGDEKRTYISLPPIVAPYKCSVLPLSNKPEFQPYLKQISRELTDVDVSHKVDDASGTIGRRYARTDEIAVPFAITMDFDTLTKQPPSVTLRERDSMSQVRIPMTEVANIVQALSRGRLSWNDVEAKYPKFIQQEASKAS